jgi:hypothetical protein
MVLIFFYFIIKYFFSKILFKLKALFFIGILVIGTVILIPILNYLIDGKFIISEGTHVFLMHKMHDDDILVPYLKENCEKKNYSLCQHKDNMPWDIIWDSRSPITKDGDWNKYKAENQAILFDILTTYKYFKLFVLKSIHQSFKQFFNFDTGDAPLSKDLLKPPQIELDNYFKHEIREFLSSKQCNQKLNYYGLNSIQFISVIISLMILIIPLFLNSRIIGTQFILSIYILLLFLLANAFICSTFSNVLDRYQSRIIWLVPFFAMILIFQIIESSPGFKKRLMSVLN